MPRTIAYLRVSTTGQTTDNQLQEIAAAGFKVEPRRVVTETVSGNVATSQRRGFTRLLDQLEPGDVLVVNRAGFLGGILAWITRLGQAPPSERSSALRLRPGARCRWARAAGGG